jgi:hypothetical protein
LGYAVKLGFGQSFFRSSHHQIGNISQHGCHYTEDSHKEETAVYHAAIALIVRPVKSPVVRFCTIILIIVVAIINSASWRRMPLLFAAGATQAAAVRFFSFL